MIYNDVYHTIRVDQLSAKKKLKTKEEKPKQRKIEGLAF